MDLLGPILELLCDFATAYSYERYYIGDNSIFEFEGNKDYTSKELMDGVKYGTDVYKRDFEQNVYKELKSMYRKKILSKDEYEHLVNHQKIMDAYSKQVELLKNFNQLPKKKAYKTLVEINNLTELLYQEGKIKEDKYNQIIDLVKKEQDNLAQK